MRKLENGKEQIYYVGDDVHTLCIGATRSSKSRTIVVQSICTLGLASESLAVGDPKAELYQYTNDFLQKLGDVAPSRTRGSFYPSALTTLRLFTSKSIYGITSTSDFSLTDVGEKKQALFIILPDEKTTFYPIASQIISQQYELLANTADKRGGRLKQRINFLLDEFGVRPYGLIRNLSVA